MARQIQNPYPGINAHFNSNLQNNGTWPEFHTIHIGDIAKTLKSVLLPLGYTVGVEQSLQHHLELDDHFVPALVVSKWADDEPVVWIELVWPSNKPPQSGFIAYDAKRKDVLQSDLVFVELDYIHQQPPTFRHLHDYTRTTAPEGEIKGRSYPYHINVIDPRPELAQGVGFMYEFGVVEAIPTVTIPLNDGEKVDFDFGLAYTKTFEEGLYGLELDYSLSPTAFESYHKPDRRLILNLMANLTDE